MELFQTDDFEDHYQMIKCPKAIHMVNVTMSENKLTYLERMSKFIEKRVKYASRKGRKSAKVTTRLKSKFAFSAILTCFLTFGAGFTTNALRAGRVRWVMAHPSGRALRKSFTRLSVLVALSFV